MVFVAAEVVGEGWVDRWVEVEVATPGYLFVRSERV